jgi:hypothetical protein
MSSTDSNTSNLTDYDWRVYNIKKERMFKGTIAVCAIYAIIAIILILSSYLFSNVRDILFVQFLPFTIVYIIGTIVIILALIIYIMSFEATKVKIYPEYPDVSCPDYWNMEILDDSSSNLFDKSLNKSLFRYRCVLNSNLFNNIDIAKNNSGFYSLTDTYNITDKKDVINDNNAINLTNDINNNFRHLYTNINDSPIKNTNKEVYSNLVKSSLIMNNYQYSDITGFSSLHQSTSNHTIPPISWKSDPTNDVITQLSSTQQYISIIKSWNGISYDLLKKVYGTNRIGVYLRDTTDQTQNLKGTAVGIIELNDSDNNSNLKYTTYPSITIDITKIAANPIQYTILDVLFEPQTPAQQKAAADAVLAKAAALRTKTDILLQTLQDTANQSLSDIRTTEGETTLDLTTCVNGKLSVNNSDNLGIPSPYIELIPNNKKNTFLPNIITEADSYTKNIPLVCDSFYPLYMSYADNNTSSNLNKNALRCTYSKLCGVPWSDMQCSSSGDDYTTDYLFNAEKTYLGDNGKLGIHISI